MLHVDTGRWSSPSCQGGPRLHGFVHLQQTTAIHDSTFARGTLRKWRDHEIFKDHQAPTLSDFPANINLCWTFTYLQKAGGLGLRKKSGWECFYEFIEISINFDCTVSSFCLDWRAAFANFYAFRRLSCARYLLHLGVRHWYEVVLGWLAIVTCSCPRKMAFNRITLRLCLWFKESAASVSEAWLQMRQLSFARQ